MAGLIKPRDEFLLFGVQAPASDTTLGYMHNQSEALRLALEIHMP
jgi:hypothetical protein